ncbi:hypothetical protein PpBr36_02292 [Pyricularia pennisetigena]|uniref:hypothetical protein n=1 Tax=Pyricularia pennisetigena TaxID=1578925 RepID=UPI0011506D0F|nr:hypothetical protein PpBr36_02292 [Pyricularia pennisetigena]TLS31094.1 hypothetical protein PpBr36_02292 [Pyricularia pennisetigena]
MDQLYLKLNYNTNSKLRTESGNRRKYCLENYTTQPPLAKLPQNPDKTATAAEIAFKIKQFAEHIIYTEPFNLIGDLKGNSFPGITHQLWFLTLKNRFLNAPTQENGPFHRILNFGTGTGIWATEFTTKNPATVVYNMDIFALLPPKIPPNCKFVIGNVITDWKRLAGLHLGQNCGNLKHFDFIHNRILLFIYPNQNLIIQNCFNNFRPGSIIKF